MNWFKRKIRKWAGVDDVEKSIETDLSDLRLLVDLKLVNAEKERAEDYKALAKRINELEEEVFDCSDDEKEFTDEDED